ncbi:hypothetical protein IscW_ISCW013761 [Ixodes scapularis]|uniref:Uncharacterized protein n=1 Tax=Ixodes scapularis TaxID=6945 RepID=B7QH02_IXOSC|nr:hypothetical protein IscW_ISCW013761 [Ixodes scapularis]|eukprot:XP_002414459.1 hypothetical protein IscW_ISCW013761 [Ixodes scapularis]
MQKLVGLILAAIICLVVAAVLLVGGVYLCFQICRDLRQNVLILWDALFFRDPRKVRMS